MVRWLRWHCPPDTGFEIRALAVWGRARYLSVTEAPHNTNFHTWMGKKHFLFLSNRRDREPNPNSGVKGSGANHYPRAPAQLAWMKSRPQKKKKKNYRIFHTTLCTIKCIVTQDDKSDKESCIYWKGNDSTLCVNGKVLEIIGVDLLIYELIYDDKLDKKLSLCMKWQWFRFVGERRITYWEPIGVDLLVYDFVMGRVNSFCGTSHVSNSSAMTFLSREGCLADAVDKQGRGLVLWAYESKRQ